MSVCGKLYVLTSTRACEFTSNVLFLLSYLILNIWSQGAKQSFGNSSGYKVACTWGKTIQQHSHELQNGTFTPCYGRCSCTVETLWWWPCHTDGNIMIICGYIWQKMVVDTKVLQAGIVIQVGQNHVKLIVAQTQISSYRAAFLCKIYSRTCTPVQNPRVWKDCTRV